MIALRRHPVSVALALATGALLGLAAALADWSAGAVYLAAFVLVLALGAGALATEQRRKGRRDRPSTGARPAARGR